MKVLNDNLHCMRTKCPKCGSLLELEPKDLQGGDVGPFFYECAVCDRVVQVSSVDIPKPMLEVLQEREMAKEEPIELEGRIVKAEKGSFIAELLDGNGGVIEQNGKPHTVVATLSGKMRQNFIRVVPGDKVRLELSPYDTTRGRITFRHR